ncbi:hypothetical protein [Spiroplasma endosymbiont of Seladonia tumulorum]|uniref:hypothetical protein n=1 Tax=Spiroplasma endosymbiont of Seladonia tumulorum TaxID=3066321 RepID=UPI0030D22AC9
MGKKIHEYNSINEQIKFLSNTEKVFYNGILFNNKLYFNSLDGTIYEYNPNTKKEILIANFTDNNSEYKISPPFIFNDKIYYFLDNTSVFYYDLNNKIVHKKRHLVMVKQIIFLVNLFYLKII